MTGSEFQQKFNIIGKSKAIKDLVDIMMQVSQSDISVLIQGESGTGKDVFARAIHGYSTRTNHQLVNVNCGAIPEGLLESELFGHKKGSFTGAIENRKGYFEVADRGTLFLDEIAEMPLTTQVKLLRVLETKEFMSIGSETVTNVDVRIIAASHKDLQKEVDGRRFRHDLYFRLKAVTLIIPPLRARREDISLLAENFAFKYARNNNIEVPDFTRESIECLYEYAWPGNIRELKNVIETAIALNKGTIINVDDLMPLMSNSPQTEESRNLPVHLNKPSDALDREMIYRALIEIKKDIMDLKNFAIDQSNNSNNHPNHIVPNEVIPLDFLEQDAIKNALNYTKGNKRRAAQLLNISERTLYRKLKEYNIEY